MLFGRIVTERDGKACVPDSERQTPVSRAEAGERRRATALLERVRRRCSERDGFGGYARNRRSVCDVAGKTRNRKGTDDPRNEQRVRNSTQRRSARTHPSSPRFAAHPPSALCLP